MASALIVFGAWCVLEKKGSTRTVSMIELFTGNGVAPFAIGADELLTKIIIPKPNDIYSSAYRKLRLRGSIDYPLASAAAFISVTDNMKVATCRVVIGAAGAGPKVIDVASSAIEGNLPSEADFEVIPQMAYEHAEGVDNLQMPGAYRKKMVSVLAKRAIKAAINEIREGT
jgi:carbon-monoxide dehydrogenase medium subunit